MRIGTSAKAYWMITKLNLEPPVEVRYRLDIIASALFGIYSGIIAPFISIAAIALGAKPWHIALLAAAPFIGKILSVFGGAYVGKYSKRKTFIVCCIVDRTCWMLTAFIVSPMLFSLLVVFLFLVDMFRGPAHMSILHAMYPNGVRGSIITRLMTVAGALGFIATLITGYALDYLGTMGHRVLFPIGAAFGLISLLVFRNIDIPEIDERRSTKETLQYIITLFRANRPLQKFLVFTTFVEGSQLLLAPLIPLLLVTTLHLPNKIIGVLFGIQTLSTILLSPFIGQLIDKYGPIVMLRSLGLTTAVATLFFFSSQWYMLIPSFILLGCVSAGIFPSFIESQKLFVPPSRVSDSGAVVATISGIRGAILPFVAVSLATSLGYPTTFFIIMIVSLMSSVVFSMDAHYQSSV